MNDTVIKYDERGNKIFFEDCRGYWEKREFDDNNNEIFYEESTGYWCKRERDDNDNLIFYENSDGLSFKREYDQNGNEICENSNDEILDDDERQLKEFYDENPPKFCAWFHNHIHSKFYEGTWNDIINHMFNYQICLESTLCSMINIRDEGQYTFEPKQITNINN